MSQDLSKSCREAQIETVEVQAKAKCLDLPFKLFGTTIPVCHDPPNPIDVSDRETNDESSIPTEDDQGVSFENSDCESQAKKAKENVEETETSESANGKKSSSGSIPDKVMPKKPDKLLPCPRCDSLETKFCYYNNYNVNQPRHFCKNCQRYWTAGGTLRNVPVGAGRRKNKHNTNNSTATTTLINSHGSLHSITSGFSLPIPIQTELSSSVISFGLEHDTPTFSNNGTQVPSSTKKVSKLVGHMNMQDSREAWWMNNTKTGTTSCSSSPWPSYIENISVWGSSATVLGKHPRSSHQPETPIMVQTPLRIYESIWENLKSETKIDSSKSTGIFK
ncbi:hypothetical protein SUGI_0121080 [Cryptomeria japonica]|uniref:cyclic dof factor 1 n=1 Tax=Cryptomeria japonica TaxID=3369 RepID=UPI0024089B68|nr:cyclic dof factor 1 [Cryptomeria japonica]GLJ10059.1 hypothetical protein SUGI_0121080 [Cryptomeria japonica]